MSGSLERRAAAALLNPWQSPAAASEGLPVIVRGEGSFVVDAAGRRLLDAVSGYWCSSLGHGRRDVIERMRVQLETLSYAPLESRAHAPAVELAERLLAMAPWGPSRVFFCSGGSEGIDWSVRAARAYWRTKGEPERLYILRRAGAYHGATLAASSLGGFPEFREADALTATVEVCAAGCCGCAQGAHAAACGEACAAAIEAAVSRLGPRRVAAFVAEPISTPGGIRVPPPGYWPAVQAVLDRHKILLILDEVVTGVGRTGRWFAAERLGIRPDLLVLAKGLSAGYAPLGAVLLSRRVGEGLASCWLPGFTFGGHPAACAAALAVLDAVDPLLERVDRLGARLEAEFRGLAAGSRALGPPQGLGLLWCLPFREGRASPAGIRGALESAGVLAYVMDGGILLAPPLTLSDEELAFLIGTLRAAVGAS